MASNRKNTNLNNIKMQAANEVGVPLKDNGYNGDLTSKQAGSVGGQMVKNMMPKLRVENRYHLPDNRDAGYTMFSRRFIEHRCARRNSDYDIEYIANICI